MDPLTGKSISLLKLSPAEEDIAWVYENFSYSCESPSVAFFLLVYFAAAGPEGHAPGCTCFQTACQASKHTY